MPFLNISEANLLIKANLVCASCFTVLCHKTHFFACSDAAVVINIKRSCLAPSIVDKVIVFMRTVNSVKTREVSANVLFVCLVVNFCFAFRE